MCQNENYVYCNKKRAIRHFIIHQSDLMNQFGTQEHDLINLDRGQLDYATHNISQHCRFGKEDFLNKPAVMALNISHLINMIN